jgi:outer membrane protein TolC
MPSVSALREIAREHNPDLIRAQRQVAVAEATRGEARGLRLPKLQLGGRYIEYASNTTDPQGEWQGSVQLSYPIFTGGARAAAHDRANAEIQAAVAEYDLAGRRVDDAIDRAAAARSAAHARVSALEAAVAQSEEVTRIDRLALDAGAGVQSDYLTAQADLFRSRAALTDARAQEVMALIELARASGQLSESWIAQNVESYR